MPAIASLVAALVVYSSPLALAPAPLALTAIAPPMATVAETTATPTTTTAWPKPRLPRFGFLSRQSPDKETMALVALHLREMVRGQEGFYSDNGTYTTRDEKVRGPSSETVTSAVTVTIVHAGRHGWSAAASHPAARGKSCVIFVGSRDRLPYLPRTRGEALVAESEAVPVCDR